MDVSQVIPDSWLSRLLDGFGAVVLWMLKGAHADFREQEKTVRNLLTEHAVFKANLSNLVDDVAEVKQGTDRIINMLLKKS